MTLEEIEVSARVPARTTDTDQVALRVGEVPHNELAVRLAAGPITRASQAHCLFERGSDIGTPT